MQLSKQILSNQWSKHNLNVGKNERRNLTRTLLENNLIKNYTLLYYILITHALQPLSKSLKILGFTNT